MTIRQSFWSADRFVSTDKLKNTLRYNWHMGVTAFGGPPVHFKIVGLIGMFFDGIEVADGDVVSFMISL